MAKLKRKLTERKLTTTKLLPPLQEYIDLVGLKPKYKMYNGRSQAITEADDLLGVKDVWISGLMVGRIVWAEWNRIYIFMAEDDHEQWRVHHIPQFNTFVADGLDILMADTLPDMIGMIDALTVEYADVVFSSNPLATVLNNKRDEMYRILSFVS